MTTTRDVLLASPLAFIPGAVACRGERSDLALDVDGVNLNFTFDAFGELSAVSHDLTQRQLHREYELDELAEARLTIRRLRTKLDEAAAEAERDREEALADLRSELRDEFVRLRDAAQWVLKFVGGDK